jgi:hypothetical protein
MRAPAGHKDCSKSDSSVPLNPAPMTAIVGCDMSIPYKPYRD